MSEAPEEVMPAVQADASSAHAASFWSAIREALRGSHKDYTVGPIGRSIVLLAIPMVLEMCMESIFAVVDIKWVSYLGPDAMATVGLTESLLTLIYAIRSEEHTSELQSRRDLVCRLLLEKKK